MFLIGFTESAAWNISVSLCEHTTIRLRAGVCVCVCVCVYVCMCARARYVFVSSLLLSLSSVNDLGFCSVVCNSKFVCAGVGGWVGGWNFIMILSDVL